MSWNNGEDPGGYIYFAGDIAFCCSGLSGKIVEGSVRWDESGNILSVYWIVDDGNPMSGSNISFTVDPAQNAVTERQFVEGSVDLPELSKEELLSAGQILAELMAGAAAYYDENSPGNPIQETGVLEELREEAQENGAVLSVAFLGVAESIDAFLTSPETESVLEAYPFLREIPSSGRISHPEGGQEIYCVVPTDPKADVTVSACGYGDNGEVLYQDYAGRINALLLSCNVSETWPDLQVRVAGEGGTIEYVPCLSGVDGSLCLPPEGGVEDFTMYLADFDTENFPGIYSGTVSAELGGGIRLKLDFRTDGEVFYTISRDHIIAEYAGTWQLFDSEIASQASQLELDLVLTYGVEDNNMWGEQGSGEILEEIHGVWVIVLDGDELCLTFVDQGDFLIDGQYDMVLYRKRDSAGNAGKRMK